MMRALIVSKTDEAINCDKVNIREQLQDFMDDPDVFDSFDYQDEKDLLQKVCDKLGRKTGITVSNIWENKDTIYAGYFVDIAEVLDHSLDAEKQNIRLSNLGSQITSQHVTGSLIIAKKNLSYDIQDRNIKTLTECASIGKYEILDVLEKIFVKDGLIIEPSGAIKTYQYIMNPLENHILSDNEYEKHYVCHEYEVYTHVMIIIADVRERNSKINKTASLLAGKPVCGSVMVAMYKKPEYDEHPPYVGLSVEKIKTILSIRQKSAHLTTGFERSERDYINFEKLLELEKTKHADKPSLLIGDIQGESLNIGPSAEKSADTSKNSN
jgi:hypothetical protein